MSSSLKESLKELESIEVEIAQVVQHAGMQRTHFNHQSHCIFFGNGVDRVPTTQSQAMKVGMNFAESICLHY